MRRPAGIYHELVQKFFSARSTSNAVIEPMNVPDVLENNGYAVRETEPMSALLSSLGAVFYTHDYLSQFPEHVGNHEEVLSIIRDVYLSVRRPNTLIVGEPGDGKRSLVRAFANKISTNWRQFGGLGGATGKPLLVEVKGRSLTRSAADLIDLARHLIGESNTLRFDEIEGRDVHHKIILFIDEIHEVVENLGSTDALRAFSKVLWDNDNHSVGIIGTTDFEHRDFMKADQSLAIRWPHKIVLNQAGFDEAVTILDANLTFLEKSRKVKLSGVTTRKITQLAEEYVADAVLPGSACNLLNEAADQLHSRSNPDGASVTDVRSVNGERTIDVESIIGVLAEKTGYEIDFLRRCSAGWPSADRHKYEETELRARVHDSQLLAAILDGRGHRLVPGFLEKPFTIAVFGSSDHLAEAAKAADIILFGAKGTVSAADLRFGTCVIDFKRVAGDAALDLMFEKLWAALKYRRARAIIFLNVDHASSIARHDVETIVEKGKLGIGPLFGNKALNFSEVLFFVHSNKAPSGPENPIVGITDTKLERWKKLRAARSKGVVRFDERGVDDFLEALLGLSDHLVHVSG